METIYDWITVIIFAGLVVIFLQRSVGDREHDSIVSYLPAAIGCAVSNWLGNQGYTLFAVAGIIALLLYIWFVLKPIDLFQRR